MEELTVVKRENVVKRIWRFYAEGFKSMTVGRTLWLIILLKLFVMFAVMKAFFFPNFLGSKFDTEEEKMEYVRGELSGLDGA